MATWLHDVDVYVSLAEGEAGPARDWAQTRLALYAPERFTAFPDDARLHDVVFAAAPPNVSAALIAALGRRPLSEGIASAASAVGVYGLAPEDPATLCAAMTAALRDDGSEGDLWLAYGLSNLGRADGRALAAAAKVDAETYDWVLPVVLIRVADAMGAADEAAKEIVAQMFADKRPMRLLALLAAMGIPLPTHVWRTKEPEEAARFGAALAHHGPFPLKTMHGSARRRLQAVVKSLLTNVTGPAAALVRQALAHEPAPEWGMLPAAVAAWLRARSPVAHEGHDHDHDHSSDPVHDVLFHAAGGDTTRMTEARRRAADNVALLLEALAEGSDSNGLVLAVAALRATQDLRLAEPILRAHGGDPDRDLRTAACACVAAASVPDLIPALLASPDAHKRNLGLIVGEFVPTQEVLAALLEVAVPADPAMRRQYLQTLAAMGDNSVVPLLEAVLVGEPAGFHASRALAEALLHRKLAVGA